MPKSLTNATSTGAGTAYDSLSHHAGWQMSIDNVTGNPTTVTVYLELSTDNSTWVRDGYLSSTVPTSGFSVADPTKPPNYVTTSTQPYRYARANLTALSGGSSPSVTASVYTLGQG